jgi:hypothetical protein
MQVDKGLEGDGGLCNLRVLQWCCKTLLLACSLLCMVHGFASHLSVSETCQADKTNVQALYCCCCCRSGEDIPEWFAFKSVVEVSRGGVCAEGWWW